MNRSKKEPKPAPVVERGRRHRRVIDAVIETAEEGYGITHEEVLMLVTEIRDLRAQLSAIARGVPVWPAPLNRSE